MTSSVTLVAQSDTSRYVRPASMAAVTAGPRRRTTRAAVAAGNAARHRTMSVMPAFQSHHGIDSTATATAGCSRRSTVASVVFSSGSRATTVAGLPASSCTTSGGAHCGGMGAMAMGALLATAGARSSTLVDAAILVVARRRATTCGGL